MVFPLPMISSLKRDGMNKGETIFGLGIFAFGALMFEETLKLPYSVDEVPGPGFLPFWVSLGIIAMGLALTLKGVPRQALSSEKGIWPELSGWCRIGIMLGALAISLLLLGVIGFFVTATLFMALVTFALGTTSKRVLVLAPILAAIILYTVFVLLLKVPLPKGILSILG